MANEKFHKKIPNYIPQGKEIYLYQRNGDRNNCDTGSKRLIPVSKKKKTKTNVPFHPNGEMAFKLQRFGR